jgi:phosphoribosylformylglycinamidine synthase PurS subunit
VFKGGKVAKAKIFITLKDGILDPQGATVAKALKNIGFKNIKDVRIGKLIEVEFNGEGGEVEENIKSMCDKLLANPVIEDYRFELGE